MRKSVVGVVVQIAMATLVVRFARWGKVGLSPSYTPDQPWPDLVPCELSRQEKLIPRYSGNWDCIVSVRFADAAAKNAESQDKDIGNEQVGVTKGNDTFFMATSNLGNGPQAARIPFEPACDRLVICLFRPWIQ